MHYISILEYPDILNPRPSKPQKIYGYPVAMLNIYQIFYAQTFLQFPNSFPTVTYSFQTVFPQFFTVP